MFDRIVIADDGSDGAMDAIAFGLKLAELGDGEIRIVAAPPELERVVEDWHADLVVVGPRAGEAGEVLGGGTVPVLVAPAGFRNLFAAHEPAVVVS